MNRIRKLNQLSFAKLRNGGIATAALVVLISIIGLFSRGINLGIDFTGGFITEFNTSQSISQARMNELLSSQIDGQYTLNSAESNRSWTVRQPEANNDVDQQTWFNQWQQQLLESQSDLSIGFLESDFIGSQVGSELLEQGGLALLTAFLLVLGYLAIRFEWRFALGALAALLHDVIAVLGFFAWSQLEFNLTSLASLLAIIGYSLNDSIIVADRVRELMKTNRFNCFNDLIKAAINSTLTRTLITSGTTLATVCCLLWLAGVPLYGFSIALFIGILVGTFSSIFIAAPMPALIGLPIDYFKQLEIRQAKELESL